MQWSSDRDEREIDRLFDGHESVDDRFEAVAEFLGALGDAIPEVPVDASAEASHLAALFAAAEQLAEEAASAPVTSASRRVAPGATKPVAARALALFAAHRWVSVAAIAIAGVVAFGGAAYAGILPASLERAVSDVVREVGLPIHIPAGTQTNPSGIRPKAQSESTQTPANAMGLDSRRSLDASSTLGADKDPDRVPQPAASASKAAKAAKTKAARAKAVAKKRSASSTSAKPGAAKKKASAAKSTGKPALQGRSPSSGGLKAKGG